MPKRVNNIFDEKIKFNYMLQAYKRAAKGKYTHKEIILFQMDLANNITQILKDIYTNKYVVGKYRKFTIYEPKKREIWSLPFRDRVVHQWYVEEFIKPIFLPQFIEDTYACLEGKGVHKAVKKLKKYMSKKYNENKEYYILKCDISKYFYSINKNILYGILERKCKDHKFLSFTKKIIYSIGSKDIGIPIGNYTSQYFANIYLNELDHYVKEKLKIKYYVRYMDDFILLVNNKQEAKKIKQLISGFLNEKLHLQLNSKTNYFKNNQGVNFCGYKLKENKIQVVKSNKKKIYKRVKKWNILYNQNKLDLKNTCMRLNSWAGHAGHATSMALIENVKNKCEWLYKIN